MRPECYSAHRIPRSSLLLEVMTKEARQRRIALAWTGFLLIVIGFLSFVGSYFLLPVVVVACFDDCPSTYFTAWETSMRALSLLPVTMGQSLFFPLVIVLLLCCLSLLAAVTVLGCSISFLVHRHRALAIWSHRAWLAGIIMLVLALPLVFFPFVRPEIGYLGMLVGYGLLWAGNHVFLTAQP